MDLEFNETTAHARRLCDPSVVASLKLPNPNLVILRTIILWAQLLGSWALAFSIPGPAWAICFLINIACITAMQLWVHDASHYSLFKNRSLNDWWATVFFAAPIGTDVRVYRHYHMTHHVGLSTDHDMDREAYQADVRGPWRILMILVRGLTGYEGFKLVVGKYLDVRSHGKGLPRQKGGLFVTLAWNILFLGACVLFGYWYLYFVLWAYPIVAISPTINIIRSVAEHQPSGHPVDLDNPQGMAAVVRTTLPSPPEKWIMYQANFNYHVEHHIFPSIPACNLPKLHRHLVDKGYYEAFPTQLQRSGFAAFLKQSRVLGQEKPDGKRP